MLSIDDKKPIPEVAEAEDIEQTQQTQKQTQQEMPKEFCRVLLDNKEFYLGSSSLNADKLAEIALWLYANTQNGSKLKDYVG